MDPAGSYHHNAGEIAKMGMIFFVAWFFAGNTRRARMPVKGLSCGVCNVPFRIFNNQAAKPLDGDHPLRDSYSDDACCGMRWLYVAILCGLGVFGVLGLILSSGGTGLNDLQHSLIPLTTKRPADIR